MADRVPFGVETFSEDYAIIRIHKDWVMSPQEAFPYPLLVSSDSPEVVCVIEYDLSAIGGRWVISIAALGVR